MRTLVIIGAGGHGLVVSEAAEAMACWGQIFFLDDKHQEPAVVNSFMVISKAQFSDLEPNTTDIAVAIGDNKVRLDLIKQYLSDGYKCPVIIHPQACVSRSATLDAGTVVLAKAAINSQAYLGLACIVNTAAVIEHQCNLADGVHVSPTACLAGNVHIGTCSWIGAGAVVINNLKVGAHVIVGAAAVVLQEVADQQCVVGVPARVKEQA